MRVHIGGDHAAYDLKVHLVNHLLAQGFDVVDHGPDRLDPDDDYPVAVLRAATGVRADEGSLGVVLGGSICEGDLEPLTSVGRVHGPIPMALLEALVGPVLVELGAVVEVQRGVVATPQDRPVWLTGD